MRAALYCAGVVLTASTAVLAAVAGFGWLVVESLRAVLTLLGAA